MLIRRSPRPTSFGKATSRIARTLEDSTGPRTGFEKVWGIPVTRQNAEWCEALLLVWAENWSLVAEEVGAAWTGRPYVPGDFENALCIFQERVRGPRC